MKRFYLKPYRWAALFSILLIASVTYVIMDTFVIEKAYQKVESVTTDTEDSADNSTDSADSVSDNSSDDSSDNSTDSSTDQSSDDTDEAVVTDTSYEDDNIKITIEKEYEYNTWIYIADIQVKDASYLKTALANDTYGRNIKATTSEIAEDHDAIFAINGDYYGFRDTGYVLRNGTLYRDTAGSGDALLIDNDGNLSTVDESDLSSMDLDNIWQILSFGPTLIENGKVVVTSSSEVSQSQSSNPRTAIGQVSDLHYIIIVSDGRTSESSGLSLLELAEQFEDRGCTTAYNLDGGGSSTMYFNGEVVNVPTDGKKMGEREVSDIVYIGY